MPIAPLAIVGGDEGLPGKPEPAIFLEAAQRMAWQPPSACIVFEDAPLGIEAARRAGMRAGGRLPPAHSAEELAGPARAGQRAQLQRLDRNPNFLESLPCCNFVMAHGRLPA